MPDKKGGGRVLREASGTEGASGREVYLRRAISRKKKVPLYEGSSSGYTTSIGNKEKKEFNRKKGRALQTFDNRYFRKLTVRKEGHGRAKKKRRCAVNTGREEKRSERGEGTTAQNAYSKNRGADEVDVEVLKK